VPSLQGLICDFCFRLGWILLFKIMFCLIFVNNGQSQKIRNLEKELIDSEKWQMYLFRIIGCWMFNYHSPSVCIDKKIDEGFIGSFFCKICESLSVWRIEYGLYLGMYLCVQWSCNEWILNELEVEIFAHEKCTSTFKSFYLAVYVSDPAHPLHINMRWHFCN